MEATDFDPLELRNALGAFATGVTIVTTFTEAKNASGAVVKTPIAMTANSFASVSLDPPLVLWNVARSAQSFEAFEAAEYFAVHILHSAQVGLSNLCATKNVDKFAEIAWHEGIEGLPVFDDYNTCFQCRVENKYDGGDHRIVVGRVLDFDNREKDSHSRPLVFYRGKYRDISA